MVAKMLQAKMAMMTNDGILDGDDNCPRGDVGWSPGALTDYDSDGCQDSCRRHR